MNKRVMHGNTKSVAIPLEITRNKKLTASAKLLYGELSELQNDKNFDNIYQYFADLYEVSIVSVYKWASELERNGYLTRERVYKEDTTQILYTNFKLIGQEELV